MPTPWGLIYWIYLEAHNFWVIIEWNVEMALWGREFLLTGYHPLPYTHTHRQLTVISTKCLSRYHLCTFINYMHEYCPIKFNIKHTNRILKGLKVDRHWSSDIIFLYPMDCLCVRHSGAHCTTALLLSGSISDRHPDRFGPKNCSILLPFLNMLRQQKGTTWVF